MRALGLALLLALVFCVLVGLLIWVLNAQKRI